MATVYLTVSELSRSILSQLVLGWGDGDGGGRGHPGDTGES